MSDLPKLLHGEGAFVRVPHIIEGLSLEHVSARPQSAPHSVYEELWHVVFWQRILLGWASGKNLPLPEHDSASWPPSPSPEHEEGWHDLVAELKAGLERARELASDKEKLEMIVNDKYHARQSLESLVAHNAYHFGRIVLLRQLMGRWPPFSGGDSW